MLKKITTQSVVNEMVLNIYGDLVKSSWEVGRKTRNSLSYVDSSGSFRYEPSPTYALQAALDVINTFKKFKENGVKLLDLGCGDGLFAMMLASLLKCNNIDAVAHGVELNTDIRSLLGNLNTTYGNFFNLTRQNVERMNVVYMFCPMCTKDRMLQLLTHVENICKPGTLIIFTNNMFTQVEMKWLGYRMKSKNLVSTYYKFKRIKK